MYSLSSTPPTIASRTFSVVRRTMWKARSSVSMPFPGIRTAKEHDDEVRVRRGEQLPPASAGCALVLGDEMKQGWGRNNRGLAAGVSGRLFQPNQKAVAQCNEVIAVAYQRPEIVMNVPAAGPGLDQSSHGPGRHRTLAGNRSRTRFRTASQIAPQAVSNARLSAQT